MFVRAQQVLESVESDFILLDIGVHEYHRFNLVINAVSDEVELENELLAEDESEVGLAQQFIEESIILLDQLVKDILQDRSYIGHFKHLKCPLLLNLLVLAVMESQIF